MGETSVPEVALERAHVHGSNPQCDGDGVGRKASPGSSPAATPVGTAFAATAEPVKGEGGGMGGGGAGREHHRLWVRRGRGRAVKPRRGPLSMSGDCGGGAR